LFADLDKLVEASVNGVLPLLDMFLSFRLFAGFEWKNQYSIDVFYRL